MFLLDTNVVSELRRAERAAPAVLAWARTTQASELFISSIRVLERGVMQLERRVPRPERDGLIGATAMEHGFTLVTRNVADFHIPGIKLLNPWGE